VDGTIDVDGRQHFVRLTEARRVSAMDDTHTVLMLPGFTEMVDRGSARNLHDAVVGHYPYSRVLSIATDGVGLPCRRLGWREGLELNFDTMASDRLAIAERLHTGPVTMINVSMGTVIGLQLALCNLREQRVELEHIVNHSHAQVPLSHVPRDMVARFLPHIAIDSAHEVARRPGPLLDHALGSLAILATHWPSYLGNIKNLLTGTSPADMYKVAEQVPTTYISGDRDPLAQRELLMRLQQALPGQINVVLLSGRGHASSTNAATAAHDIASIDSRAEI
jgi:pimeloyl-ACP methyl ester carboxylesterase